MEGFDHARAKKLLSLPCGASVAMIIGIGRRAEGGVYGPQFRGPREAFVHKI
jgi:nitroreductase